MTKNLKQVANVGTRFCGIKIGRTGEKVYVGRISVWLMSDGSLEETRAYCYCGSVKGPFGNYSRNVVREGKVTITCKKCGGPKVVDLDERNRCAEIEIAKKSQHIYRNSSTRKWSEQDAKNRF